MATDGKSETYWKSADNDKTPYITLDVERTITLTSGKITFTCQYTPQTRFIRLTFLPSKGISISYFTSVS